MSQELGPKIMPHYSATGGGTDIKEGRFVSVGKFDQAEKGIHFHYASNPTLEQATIHLRKAGEILKDETVVALWSLGKDQDGLEGYAAVTDRERIKDFYDPDLDKKFHDAMDYMLRRFIPPGS